MHKTTNLLMSSVAAVAILASASAYAQGGEVRVGPETYSADEFNVAHFVGTVEIIVEDRNTIEVSAVGDAEHMERLEIENNSNGVEVSYERDDFRWNDWSTWVSWWGGHNIDIDDYPVVTVRVPVGTPVDVDRMTGNLRVGDLNGSFDLSGVGVLDATIGNVQSAEISAAGAADIELGNVDGELSISISGAGDITAGSSARAEIIIRGAGDIVLGAVDGGLDISVAGASDVRVASVDGPVDITLRGSGDVRINGGHASSFDVSIAGSGDVEFDGTAVDPEISIAGSGSVYIKDYEGRLDHSGMGSVQIGS